MQKEKKHAKTCQIFVASINKTYNHYELSTKNWQSTNALIPSPVEHHKCQDSMFHNLVSHIRKDIISSTKL